MTKKKVEYNGYICTQGETAKDCSFVLPKDRNKYLKKEKEDNARSKMGLLELIKNELTKITAGFDPNAKKDFLYKELGCSSFTALHSRKESDLMKDLLKLNQISKDMK